MKLAIASKAFEDRTLFRDLELGLEAGEFVALTGASGIGKTTLLRIIAGLDLDWQGELSFDGLEPVGFVFQEHRLMPWLTALENIELVVPDAGRSMQLLESVGLAEAAGRYPRQLSGGMQRRVALARALSLRPRLLLMDEPFASLDQRSAEECRELLLASCAELGTTVLLVTHDLGEALSMADRVLVLERDGSGELASYAVPGPRPRDLNQLELAGLRGAIAQHL